MIASSRSARIDRLVLGLALALAAACTVFVAYRAVRNPWDARLAALEARLAQIQYEPETFGSIEKLDYVALLKHINSREALWSDLVAPPPPPAPVEAEPDLNAQLAGVTVRAREEIVDGNSVRIRVRTPANPSGSWLSVGDAVNGLTIAEIRPDAVIFQTEINGKTYTVSHKRN